MSLWKLIEEIKTEEGLQNFYVVQHLYLNDGSIAVVTLAFVLLRRDIVSLISCVQLLITCQFDFITPCVFIIFTINHFTLTYCQVSN